jgi:hypothetical protein
VLQTSYKTRFELPWARKLPLLSCFLSEALIAQGEACFWKGLYSAKLIIVKFEHVDDPDNTNIRFIRNQVGFYRMDSEYVLK